MFFFDTVALHAPAVGRLLASVGLVANHGTDGINPDHSMITTAHRAIVLNGPVTTWKINMLTASRILADQSPNGIWSNPAVDHGLLFQQIKTCVEYATNGAQTVKLIIVNKT